MFIRLITLTNKEEECKKIFDDVISDIAFNIEKIKDLTMEPYWKIEDMYVLHAEIKFKEAFSEERFKSFLDSVCDEWDFNGFPILDALISKAMEGYTYIKDGISILSIAFDQKEIIFAE